MIMRQFTPPIYDMAVVLGWGRHSRAIVNTIVVEKNAENLVASVEHRPGKVIGRISSLMGVRALVDHNREFHLVSLEPDMGRCIEALTRTPPVIDVIFRKRQASQLKKA